MAGAGGPTFLLHAAGVYRGKPMHRKRACLLVALLAFAVLARANAAPAAERFPVAAVKIIVPNPGGMADILPRIFADARSNLRRQPVVVENRAGAAGNIAAEAFARAADGYTLLASPPINDPPIIEIEPWPVFEWPPAR
jgi:tripartite-type tricarboxylate transporter receptor subunit TctC